MHGYLRIDADLVLPKVRAQIESECTLIAKGLERSREKGEKARRKGFCLHIFSCLHKNLGNVFL